MPSEYAASSIRCSREIMKVHTINAAHVERAKGALKGSPLAGKSKITQIVVEILSLKYLRR